MSIANGFINSTIICNEKKEVDLDALNLLAFNKLSAFCSCSYKNEKKHHHFIYNITDMLPLVRLQAGLSFENVVDILSAVLNMFEQLDQNRLSLSNVKQSREYIFKADDGYKFVYLPVSNKVYVSKKDFLLKLIAVIHHKDIRLTQLVKELRHIKNEEQALKHTLNFVSCYDFSGYGTDAETSLLSEEGATTLLNMKAVAAALDEVYEVNKHEPDDYSSADETTLLNAPLKEPEEDEGETTILNLKEEAYELSSSDETTLLSEPLEERYDDSEGETTLLNMPSEQEDNIEAVSEMGQTTILSRTELENSILTVKTKETAFVADESSEYETTLLSAKEEVHNKEIESKDFLYLIRKSSGGKITVDVTPFTIGNDDTNMDYVLEADSVSRHHATIIYEDGNYLVVDNDSTNGTTVEGIKLQPGEKAVLGNGYTVIFGNEVFVAYIERGNC